MRKFLAMLPMGTAAMVLLALTLLGFTGLFNEVALNHSLTMKTFGFAMSAMWLGHMVERAVSGSICLWLYGEDGVAMARAAGFKMSPTGMRQPHADARQWGGWSPSEFAIDHAMEKGATGDTVMPTGETALEWATGEGFVSTAGILLTTVERVETIEKAAATWASPGRGGFFHMGSFFDDGRLSSMANVLMSTGRLSTRCEDALIAILMSQVAAIGTEAMGEEVWRTAISNRAAEIKLKALLSAGARPGDATAVQVMAGGEPLMRFLSENLPEAIPAIERLMIQDELGGETTPGNSDATSRRRL